MTNVLTTGGDGFLGSILTSELKEMAFVVRDLQDQSSHFVDITRPFTIASTVSPDLIIHLAGKAHSVPKTPAEEKAFFDVNFEGTRHLCAAIDDLPSRPQAFVFISTVAVYGVDSGDFIDELHPLNGATPYARSKIQAEEYLQQWAADRGITLGILRLPLIAGPTPPGNLGAMIKGIKTGRYLRIGKGNARKSIIMASDIAAIIPKAAEIGGIFNLTDGYHPTFAQLEELIAGQSGKPTPKSIPVGVARLLGWTGDIIGKKFPVNSDTIKKITSNLTFNDSKARKELGWSPRKVLDHFKIA